MSTENKLHNFRQIIEECFPDVITSYDELIHYIKTELFNDTTKYIQPWEISDIVVSIYECYDIEGIAIHELTQTNNVLSGSLLLASTVANQPSINIEYCQLSAQLFADIENCLKDAGYLKTMAYQQKNNFSLADHSHDKLYTANLNIQYSDWMQQLVEDQHEMVLLGRISATTQNYAGGAIVEQTDVFELSCPKITAPLPVLQEPAIGEIKFIPVSNLAELYEGKLIYYGDNININIYADDFDGWVFPNGTTFLHEVNEFAHANAAFGNSSTSFTVPNLDSFVYGIHPDKNSSQLVKFVQQKTVVGPHGHTVSSSGIYGKTEALNPKVTELRVTSNEFNAPPIPADKDGIAVAYFGDSSDITVKQTPDYQTANIQLTDNKKIDINIQTVPNDNSLDIYQPACQLMPVLMYIGAKTYFSNS